jgi:hypothetical protein
VQSGGVRAAPTPPGVPVAMMSPGSSVITALSWLTSAATVKTMFLVLECCTVTPLTRVSISRSCGSGTSAAVTRNGPTGANVSKLLPSVHWLVQFWTSRALTSLKAR